MPLMPMPPIPTKWMGPISRGSLMVGSVYCRHARACPTAVWHGVCLSCRLLHGSISTNISAPLRRTGCVWSEVKSGLLWLGGWGGLGKFNHRAPLHHVGSDEAGEGEWACDDFIGVVSQTQQQKGGQRDRDLNANGVFGSSQEVADLQGLLDPSKEQLDGPSTLVQVGDVLRACLKIIGEDVQHLAGLDDDANFTDEIRHWVVAGWGEPIWEEIVALASGQRVRRGRPT